MKWKDRSENNKGNVRLLIIMGVLILMYIGMGVFFLFF